jgi:uncharacterized membrane protein
MKLFLLVLSIVAFLILAILAITGGTWSTADHLMCILGIGLGLFAGSFLPIP